MYRKCMELNISNIFSNFIDNAEDGLKQIFNKYCLGAGLSSEISYKDYITLLKRSLRYRNDQGRRRVNYIRLNTGEYLHNQLKLVLKNNVYVNSLYVAKESYSGKYPIITMTNYEYYTGIVFLIHNDVDYNSIDMLELVKLTSAWYEYSINEILGVVYPNRIYRYANKDEIYHSDKKLNSSELRKLKIYTNRIFGKEMLLYE